MATMQNWQGFELHHYFRITTLRLIVGPYVFFNLIKPWLVVFDIQCLREGFWFIIEVLNVFRGDMPVNSRIRSRRVIILLLRE